MAESQSTKIHRVLRWMFQRQEWLRRGDPFRSSNHSLLDSQRL